MALPTHRWPRLRLAMPSLCQVSPVGRYLKWARGRPWRSGSGPAALRIISGFGGADCPSAAEIEDRARFGVTSGSRGGRVIRPKRGESIACPGGPPPAVVRPTRELVVIGPLSSPQAHRRGRNYLQDAGPPRRAQLGNRCMAPTLLRITPYRRYLRLSDMSNNRNR